MGLVLVLLGGGEQTETGFVFTGVAAGLFSYRRFWVCVLFLCSLR